MTDKQIIIDGCDVSGCEFLAKEDDYCSYSGVTYAYKGQCMFSDEEMCKEHPKCFYKKILKQLKRKEQECEGLKEEIKIHNDDMFKNPPEKRFYCKGCTLPYISKKLKQTITEIKEIAEKIDDSGGCDYGDYDCDNCSSLEQETVCTYKVKKLILQKISECEVK